MITRRYAVEAPGVEGSTPEGRFGTSGDVSHPAEARFQHSFPETRDVSRRLATSRCSTVVSSSPDPINEMLETATRAWDETGDARLVRRLLLDIMKGLEDFE